MTLPLLYETEIEKRQHLSAIHNLAIDLRISEDFLQKVYETELNSLKAQAKIKDFLTVLVIKRIKEKAIAGQK